jgi:hypothetical protein
MAGVSPHPAAGYGASAMPHAPAGGAAPPPPVASLNQTAEFFLSNYRLGKTLGIGSFGKVRDSRWARGRAMCVCGGGVATAARNRRSRRPLDRHRQLPNALPPTQPRSKLPSTF